MNDPSILGFLKISIDECLRISFLFSFLFFCFLLCFCCCFHMYARIFFFSLSFLFLFYAFLLFLLLFVLLRSSSSTNVSRFCQSSYIVYRLEKEEGRRSECSHNMSLGSIDNLVS